MEPADGAGSRDVAERLTSRRRRHIEREVAELGDRETVQGWLRTLGSDGDQEVYVHRPWGTVAAVANRGNDPVAVFLSDGDQSWQASPPGAGDRADLTPDQVEHVLLDALTSSGRPEWPDWHLL